MWAHCPWADAVTRPLPGEDRLSGRQLTSLEVQPQGQESSCALDSEGLAPSDFSHNINNEAMNIILTTFFFLLAIMIISFR